MLTPEQSRAARGWLDWTQQTLAERSRVALSTVRDFEKGRRVPIANNLYAMRQALEHAGIRFVFEGEEATGIAITHARDPSDQTAMEAGANGQ